MTIVRAGRGNLEPIIDLALLLWPNNERIELQKEFAPLLETPKAAIYLAKFNGEWIGFAQCQLRYDYVEGTNSSPVGYLEGIFVKEAFRRRGIAGALLEECQQDVYKRQLQYHLIFFSCFSLHVFY